jgi:site-specific DNA-methyltransferase (adenine-specific)
MDLKPYYQDDRVTIYHGDCRLIWPQLPRFDLLLTDPPYGIDFNATKQNLPGATERKNIEGDNDVSTARWLFGMLWHVNDAVIFGANCFPHLLPHRGRWICWDKRLTEAADKMLGSPFELAWCNRTSGFDKILRKLHGGVVNADGGKRVHPTQKPSGLFSQIISDDFYVKSNTIIDPFMGSGSVLLAAKIEGKTAIGIEIEERYCEAAAKRLTQGVLF